MSRPGRRLGLMLGRFDSAGLVFSTPENVPWFHRFAVPFAGFGSPPCVPLWLRGNGDFPG